MLRYDVETLAYLALIGICLILIGALLTAGPITIEQRGSVLAGIFAVLGAVAWRARHRSHRRTEDDEDPK